MRDFRIVRPPQDTDLPMKVIAPLLECINSDEDDSTLVSSIEDATRGQRAIYACSLYQFEVNNGGHHQFFSNSTGLLWEEAITGLRLLRAIDYEAILKRAVAFFPYHQPAMDRLERNEELDAIVDGAFDELDNEFYAMEKTNDFEAIFLAFIQNHPDQFFR